MAETNVKAAARRIVLRRLILMALVLTTAGAAGFEAFRVMVINGIRPLEWPIFGLFLILMFPITLGFWTAVFGFFVQLFGGDELSLSGSLSRSRPTDLPAFRTAILIPAYNEDTIRLFAGVKVIYDSVDETGWLRHFDFFILSDTVDPDLWVREEIAFHELRQRVSDPTRLYYRNRSENVDRKAGNIAEFCASWGEDFRYMIVLDADSVMAGSTLVNMVRLMELRPRAGIIQTPPIAVNRQTFFGRVFQFAIRAYSPMFIQGMNFWQVGEANYWGHNAIIRVRPFVEHCELPKLPGQAPLGGSILSHDFVEAALMRRAGWKVYVASDLGGSYEEIPANLIGHAARDRRWCQGNLQHLNLLHWPGLNWLSRLHFGMGIMAYGSSLLWILLLLLTTVEALIEASAKHRYFEPKESLFPVWNVSIVNQAILLFTSVMTMLILPKFLSLVLLLFRKRRLLPGFGGGFGLTFSILVETLLSVLLSPVLAIMHSRFVVITLLGRKVEWAAQDRGDAETGFKEAIRRHAGITLLALGWAALLYFNTRTLFWWLSPVLAGLILSIPISVWSSKVSTGRFAKACRLFLIPEEAAPPPILKRLRGELETAAHSGAAQDGGGLARVLHDPRVRSIHLSLLPPTELSEDPLTRHHLEGLKLKVRSGGESALKTDEKRDLLRDAHSIRELCHDALG